MSDSSALPTAETLVRELQLDKGVKDFIPSGSDVIEAVREYGRLVVAYGYFTQVNAFFSDIKTAFALPAVPKVQVFTGSGELPRTVAAQISETMDGIAQEIEKGTSEGIRLYTSFVRELANFWNSKGGSSQPFSSLASRFLGPLRGRYEATAAAAARYHR